MSEKSPQSNPRKDSKIHILVVDDEPSICAVLVSVLGNLGYETVAMGDARAALRLIESEESQIDILITDFAMPQMSGLELIARAKAARPSLSTILASGEVDQPNFAGGPRPDAFLEKPFSSRALSQIVKSLASPNEPTRTS